MRFPDGLRAIAAMLVILPHSVGLLAYWSSPTPFTRMIVAAAPLGSCGVQIFFVLSGFVIAYSLRNAKFSPSYIGIFLLRRSIRLDPPYWAAIAIYLGFISLSHYIGHNPPRYPSAAKLVAHLLYAQDVLGYGDINVVFWTLCIEIQFYVVFCLLLWSMQIAVPNAPRTSEGRRAPFLALFVVSLAWPAGLISSSLYPGSFFPYGYAFLAGAIVWWTVGKELPPWTGYPHRRSYFLPQCREMGFCFIDRRADGRHAAAVRPSGQHLPMAQPMAVPISWTAFLLHLSRSRTPSASFCSEHRSGSRPAMK